MLKYKFKVRNLLSMQVAILAFVFVATWFFDISLFSFVKATSHCGGGTESGDSCTYTSSGSDTFTVPAGVTSVTVTVWGGGGGGGAGGSAIAGADGAGGGFMLGTVTVTPAESITVRVGGGGGAGTSGSVGGGGAGGGYSGILRSATELVIGAGGGGGGGGDNTAGNAGEGGVGGGATGTDGTDDSTALGGGGGTETAGGTGPGAATDGASLAGGAGGSTGSGAAGGTGGTNGGGAGGDGNTGGGRPGGGGGGAGHFGGGGGEESDSGSVSAAGGGGGSSYIDSGATATSTESGSGTSAGGESDANWASPAGRGGNGGAVSGNGTAGSDGRVVITWVGSEPALSQDAYRWFQNLDSTAVGGTTSNKNQPTFAPSQGTPFRLRLLLGSKIAVGRSGTTTKLQVAVKNGTCSGSSYSDVETASGGIRFFNNTSPSDGDTIATSTFDLFDGATTTIRQDYEEANNATNGTAALAAGESGLWDYSLVDNSASANTTYCFRVLQSGGEDLASYRVYPEITTRSLARIHMRPMRLQSISDKWAYRTHPYRKKFVIDNTKVNSSERDFPVLLSLGNDADLLASVQTDGSDLLFTDENGNQLAHEVEEFNATTGSMNSWVKANISSTTDTTLYMYYGGTQGSGRNATTSVWTNGYAGVWHLGENPASGATDNIKDSTANANHGGDNGTMTVGDQVGGRIGGALDFDGTDDYINISDDNALDLPSDFSISAWVYARSLKTSDGSNWDSIVTKGQEGETPTDNHNYIFGYNGIASFGTVNRWLFVLENSAGTNCNLVGNAAASTNTWYYVVAVFDDTSNISRIFVDGTQQNEASCSLTPNTNARPVRIGDDEISNGTPFDGLIDHATISNVARTDTWITTEYNNQSATSTFYTVSSEQDAPTSKITFRTMKLQSISDKWAYRTHPYRKKFVIDNTKVNSSERDFPVLLSLGNDADLLASVQTDGSDLLFTDENGNQLAHEVEEFNATTGSMNSWVKANISSTTDTTLYMYYGGTQGSGRNATTSVWTNGYAGVWHLTENPANGATTNIKDSTANANHGGDNGTMTVGDQVGGRIGGALDFDGTDDYVDVGDLSALSSDSYTASFWVKANALDNEAFPGIMWNNAWTGFNIHTATDGTFYAGTDTGSRITTSSGYLVAGSWIHIVITLEDGVGHKLFKNGSQTHSNSNHPSSTWGTTYISGDTRWEGLIDQVTISNTVRADTWITTEYNNQSATSTFYTVSSEQDAPKGRIRLR